MSLLALLAAGLAGCTELHSLTTSTPTTTVTTTGSGDEMKDLLTEMRTPAPAPTAPPPQPVPPAPRPPEPKAPPAVATKGAEKLLVTTPPPPPRSSETVEPPAVAANNVQASPPPQAEPPKSRGADVSLAVAATPSLPPPPDASGVVATSTATELIVKGPPRKYQPRRAGLNGFGMVGLVLCLIAAAVGAQLFMKTRQGKPVMLAAKGKSKGKTQEEIFLPPELEMREYEDPPTVPNPALVIEP